MMELRPWWHISNRLPRNPFNFISKFLGLEWCQVCQMEVTTDTQAANADGVDVYRKRCKRCGHVIMWGIGRRHLTSATAKPLPEKALRFVQETGRDRR